MSGNWLIVLEKSQLTHVTLSGKIREFIKTVCRGDCYVPVSFLLYMK